MNFILRFIGTFLVVVGVPTHDMQRTILGLVIYAVASLVKKEATP